MMEMIKSKKQKENKLKKCEQNLRDLWDTIKETNAHIVKIPEAEEGEMGAERIFEEIMAENFPNLMTWT